MPYGEITVHKKDWVVGVNLELVLKVGWSLLRAENG